MRDAEDHRPCIAALVRMPIHLEPEIEILRITDLLLRHQPGVNGSKGVTPLALIPLTSALELLRALGDVIDDAVARHVFQRLINPQILAGISDHYAELDLPVGFFEPRGISPYRTRRRGLCSSGPRR